MIEVDGGMGARETQYVRKALALWPRLDSVKLSRTKGDPRRISKLVARRTALPEPAILQLILGKIEVSSSST
ncbi:MAG TPA: hypothetical protein VEY67_05485 [Candidatus Dormibacteraeota bacterium]|nr:hypothetical protein [Candidatus Dormibacteraeota bacterium]